VSNKNVEGWEVIFFLQDFCAVNFGGRKNFPWNQKMFFCLFVFFVKSQRLYQAQSVPQVFHLMPPFSIIQKFSPYFLHYFCLLGLTVLFFLFFYLWNI